MTDLETLLADALKAVAKVKGGKDDYALFGFHEAAAIAREVVAEKDAEIARLKATT